MKQMNRRHFLVGAGGAILSIPFLSSLSNKAEAATVASKRFICLAQDNGRYYGHWYPSVTEETKLAANAAAQYMRDMRLSSVSGQLSQTFNSTYFDGAIREKLLLIRGLDGFWQNLQGHQASSLLAANGGANKAMFESFQGPSIDWLMTNNRKSNTLFGNPNSFLALANQANNYGVTYSYDAATMTQSRVSQIASPIQSFTKIFLGSTPDAALVAKKSLIVDRVLENYKSVVGSRKIASEEKRLLEQHMQSVYELQKTITADSSLPAGCVVPAPPGAAAGSNDPVNLARVNKQHVEIMAAAIKCGIVNFGSIMLNREVDDTVYSNIGVDVAYHGGLSHTTMNSDSVLKISRLFADSFGYFVSLLNVAEPGTSGTYLDNSLVLYGNVMGDGRGHQYNDMAIMLAGGLSGKFKMGRYIDYTNRAAVATRYTDATNNTSITYQGRNYSALLVSIMQAMGLSAADYQQANVPEGFGSPIYRETNVAEWRRDRKNPLPGLFT